MTTPHSKQARINRIGHTMRRTDPDYGFIFSENYDHWIGGSARRKHNKRAYVYNKANREKAKALKKAQQ